VKHQIEEVKVDQEVLKKARDLYSEHSDKLEQYIDELLDWNAKINLVSRNVSRETVREHVIHSLIPIELGLLSDIDEWVDSGTGGGLPGIPLALIFPDKKFYLNDNVRKKMKAVTDIAESLNLENVEILAKSISLVGLKTGAGIVTKHAFKIYDLLRLTKKKPWKKVVMWKGVEGAYKEMEKVHSKIKCTIYSFQFGEEFYEGKGLVVLEK